MSMSYSAMNPMNTDSPSQVAIKAPKVILGHMGLMSESLEAHFRQKGWRVALATESKSVSEYAVRCNAAAVVLPVAPLAESGFLTCAKLMLSMPRTKVYLVGPAEEELERFALFAGAAGYFDESLSPGEIAKAIAQK